MDIESNPGPTTPSTHQFSSLFNTTQRIQLKLIGYQHHRKNYDFYTANNIIPKSLLPRCIQPLTLITFGSTKNGETFAALWPQTPYPADQGMQKKDKTFTKGTDILQEPLSRTL